MSLTPSLIPFSDKIIDAWRCNVCNGTAGKHLVWNGNPPLTPHTWWCTCTTLHMSIQRGHWRSHTPSSWTPLASPGRIWGELTSNLCSTVSLGLPSCSSDAKVTKGSSLALPVHFPSYFSQSSLSGWCPSVPLVKFGLPICPQMDLPLEKSKTRSGWSN